MLYLTVSPRLRPEDMAALPADQQWACWGDELLLIDGDARAITAALSGLGYTVTAAAAPRCEQAISTAAALSRRV